MTTQVAEQEATTNATEGNAASESIDARIAESIAKHSERLGVTTDDAAAKATESQATLETTEPEAEAEASTEQTEKVPEVRVFTAEELGDPKLYYKLDEKGWADLTAQHPQIAAGFKAIQTELGRRETAVAARERALTQREATGTQTTTEARAAAPSKVSGAEIVDAINDPDRAEATVVSLIDRYLESKGINPVALQKTSNDNTFNEALQLAAFGDEKRGIPPMESIKDEKVQDEMLKESDPRIQSMLRDRNPEVRAAGLQWAASNAELRLAKAPKPAPAPTKEDPVEKAKAAAKAASAKPQAKGKAIASAAAEGDRKASVSSDDKSRPLDERIQSRYQHHLENITTARSRL